jgi:hypothetical protein
VPAYHFGSYLDPHQPLVFVRVPGNLDSVSAHILKIANFWQCGAIESERNDARIRRYPFDMRLLAVALLFVTGLTAQRRMGGFGGHAGFRAPTTLAGQGRWMGGGVRGGFGVHSYGRPGHGFIGGGYYRSGFRYGWPVYGGVWGWGGSYYPSGWYSAPLWTAPAAYPDWAPYPYNTGPTVIIVTAPAATTEASPTVVELNRSSTYRSSTYRPAAREQDPDRVEKRSLTSESWAYLIAARDGTIWLAREYRVEGGILHFATMSGNWKRLPLAEVNDALTEQLNRERGVAVDLR